MELAQLADGAARGPDIDIQALNPGAVTLSQGVMWLVMVLAVYGIVPITKSLIGVYERREERLHKAQVAKEDRLAEAAVNERAALVVEFTAWREELTAMRLQHAEDAERRGARSEIMRRVEQTLGRVEKALGRVEKDQADRALRGKD